jgi:hypothetical protein
MRTPEVVVNGRKGLTQQPPVISAVYRQLMAGGAGCSAQLAMADQRGSEDEKRRPHVQLLQRVQHRRRGVQARPVVKRHRHMISSDAAAKGWQQPA